MSRGALVMSALSVELLLLLVAGHKTTVELKKQYKVGLERLAMCACGLLCSMNAAQQCCLAQLRMQASEGGQVEAAVVANKAGAPSRHDQHNYPSPQCHLYLDEAQYIGALGAGSLYA